MLTCSAINCSYKQYLHEYYHSKKAFGKLFLHKFPFSRPEILQEWVKNIGRENWMPSKTSVLCSAHFTEDCFDKAAKIIQLKPDAVPTIFDSPSHLKEVSSGINGTEQLNLNLPTCDTCGKKFSTKNNLIRHKKNVHAANNTSKSTTQNKKTFECRVCKIGYSAISNRRRHEITIHGFFPELKNKKLCSECGESFEKDKDIVNHFHDSHPDITICAEKHSFKSIEDFKDWKMNVEKETSSLYVKKQNYKKQDSSAVKSFICHRSGNFISESRGKRRIKKGGSNKIGYFCPSSIRSKILPDQSVEVSFVITHIGHDCEVERMKSCKSNKREIARLMHAGDPHQSIHELNIETNDEIADKEKSTLVQEIKRNQSSDKTLTSIKQNIISTILGLISEVDNITDEEQCKEFLSGLTVLKDEYSDNNKFHIPLVISNKPTLKNRTFQMHFPSKKKRKLNNMSSIDQLENDDLQINF